jgi:hypothetical protein
MSDSITMVAVLTPDIAVGWLGQPALHLRKPCRCFSELVLLADGALEQAWNVSVEGSVGLHKQEFIFCLVEARIS